MPLTYTVEQNIAPDVAFTIDFDRYVFDRWNYKWTITVDGKVLATGDDIKSGCTTPDRPAPLGEMMASFLSFFSAFGEAVGYEQRNKGIRPENIDLFPECCKDLAYLIGEYLDPESVHDSSRY